MRTTPVAVLTLTALALTAPAWSQTTIALQAQKDNTMYQDGLGALSNALGDGVFAGKTARSEVRRGLLKFDLSTLPAGATITGASLILTVDQAALNASATSMFRLLKDWGEGTSTAGLGGGGGGGPATPGDATWVHRFFDTQNWAFPGGTSATANPDFAPLPTATQTIGGPGVYTWNVLSDVLLWQATPASNFGWIILGDEDVISTAKRFSSREHAVVTQRPILSITLSVPCYANCDGSTTPPVLNALDFSCFLGRYVAGDPFANCDGSTTPPTLNALDFSCFLQRYAAGC